MAETFQDYLRKMAAYNAQKQIVSGGQAIQNPYGPPEYLSAYMEGQSAAEERARGRELQERQIENQEDAVEAQKNAEMAQLGTTAVLGGAYLTKGSLWGVEAAKGTTAATTAGATAGTETTAAISGQTAITGGEASVGAEAAGAPIGAMAAVPALTYGAYKVGQAITGGDSTKEAIKSIAAPFFDPIGTVKSVGHTIGRVLGSVGIGGK